MDKINNIKIKNFKSLRDVEINDCRRVNVFIGYPNVGKSNILEALSGFSLVHKKMLENKSVKNFIRFSRFTDIFFDNDVKRDISIILNDNINLLYHLIDLENVIGFIFGHNDQKSMVIKNIKIDRGTLYSSFNINKSGYFSYKKNDTIDEYVNQPLIKRYNYKSDIKFKSSKYLELKIPHGSNIGGVLEIDSVLRNEFNYLLKDYNLNLQFDRTVKINKLELRKTLKDETSITIDWDLIADTIKRLFFYKVAIASNENSVLLFEEPEAHMFPPYISKFTTDVVSDKNNNQFFISTHSPFVLNDFMEDLDKEDLAIYAVGYKKETGETVIHRMNDDEITDIYQYGIDLFFNLENYLKDAV